MDELPFRHYVEKLGIEPEASNLYIELTKRGYSSALQLAKITGVSRTQVYRHLEMLQERGLVSAEQLSYGTIYRALPFENVEALIASREAENKSLRRNLEAMSHMIQTIAGSAGPKATVQHYYGIAGLKQVNWNLTKADHEFRVFEAAHLSQHLDKAFSRRCRERYIERELISYDLTNAEHVTATELKPIELSRAFFRYIDPAVLTINFEVYLYNDLVTLVDYSAEQQLALEIHHPTLHAMMRQLYDAMWAIATPMEIEK